MLSFNFEDPRRLALLTGLSGIMVSISFYILNKIGVLDPHPKFYWMSACAFLLVYAIFNCIISLRVENSTTYWSYSIMMFVLLAIITGCIAYLFSGINLFDAGSYEFLYFVVTFVYLVFISIVNFVKKIVGFAQKEVWLHPKLRNKK